MITFTTEIQYVPEQCGMSILGTLIRKNADPREIAAFEVISAAIEAAQDIILQGGSGGHGIHGGPSLVPLIKERLKATGIKFEGSAFEQTLKDQQTDTTTPICPPEQKKKSNEK